MSKKTKYEELKDILKMDEIKWKQYERDASEFAHNFKKALLDYLECPDESIHLQSFFKIDEDGNPSKKPDFVYKFSSDYLLWLGWDGFWRFSIMIDYDRYWIQIVPWVKPMGDKLLVKTQDNAPLINVSKGNISGIAEDTVKSLLIYLAGKFNAFVQGSEDQEKVNPKREIGFKLGDR